MRDLLWSWLSFCCSTISVISHSAHGDFESDSRRDFGSPMRLGTRCSDERHSTSERLRHFSRESLFRWWRTALQAAEKCSPRLSRYSRLSAGFSWRASRNIPRGGVWHSRFSRCSSFTRCSVDARARSANNQQAWPARPTSRRDREDRFALQERDHHHSRRARGKREEHHGRHDARGGVRVDNSHPGGRSRRGCGARSACCARGGEVRRIVTLDGTVTDRRIIGMPASPGIVIGPVHLLLWEVPDVPHTIIPDEAVPGEIARLHAAIDRAKERLEHVKRRAENHTGPEEAAIFDVQIHILSDIELIQRVEGLIRQNIGAEKAFDLVLIEWRQHFSRHTHSMMRERVGDLTDVHIRVLSVLLGLPDHDPVDVPKGANAILVTHDLTPSLTVQLDREAIAGIATDAGTRTSHVAILARSLGLPAVVGLRTATEQLKGTERVILDGTAGILVINPSHEDVEIYRERARREAEDEAELRALVHADAVTQDGVRLTLRANLDLPEDADYAAHSGAEGVGLMRTEFLVVSRATMPDEEEQYREYRRVLEAFDGRPVVIRTFDIGGDKLPVGGYPSEANPFLGWRAIRMCLDQPDLFKTQLRALLRSAVHGDLRIMLPLVVTVDEVRQTRELLAE